MQEKVFSDDAHERYLLKSYFGAIQPYRDGVVKHGQEYNESGEKTITFVEEQAEAAYSNMGTIGADIKPKIIEKLRTEGSGDQWDRDFLQVLSNIIEERADST